jgi:hypothetical protein
MDGGASYNPRTVEEVFRDFKGRRAGMIKALTAGTSFCFFYFFELFFYIKKSDMKFLENYLIWFHFYGLLQMLKSFTSSVILVRVFYFLIKDYGELFCLFLMFYFVCFLGNLREKNRSRVLDVLISGFFLQWLT